MTIQSVSIHAILFPFSGNYIPKSFHFLQAVFRVKVLKTLPEAPPNEGQQILHAV